MQYRAFESWLRQELGRLTERRPEEISLELRFSELGVDSALAVSLLGRMQDALGEALPASLLWRYPTPEALLRWRRGEVAQKEATLPSASDAPIAVVGVACRFPGAPDLACFRDLLFEGRDAVTETPPERWDADALYDPDRAAPGRAATRHGGYLEDIAGFDAAFWGIAAREAVEMDPHQRLALELVWEALEDAGIPPDSLRGERVGVYLGAMWAHYGLLRPGLRAIQQHSAVGWDLGVAAGRISYALGLRGPSMVVNTACSSSLVAAHLGLQSLRAGECRVAIVGGANVMVSPHGTVLMSKFGGMAADGRCKSFDARADGYVRAEGGGVLVLRPLADAVAAGDPVRGLLLGSAVNNDGYSNGLTAPSPEAQEAMLREACARAGVSPRDVHFVEAHGTGTALGDPIEASALSRVFGPGRARPLAIGSVKSNLGHLEAAAGVAGLIKALLCVEARAVAPTLHLQTLNPAIDATTLRVPTAREPWPEPEGPATAGVSSFGFGGTNAHVLVQAPDPAPPALEPHPARPPAVVFVFPGSGGQWAGMGQRLLRTQPAFRAALRRCDALLRPALGGSLLERVARGELGDGAADPLRSPVAQFALQFALAEVLRRHGVQPDLILGHSMGEVAAAVVAGALSLEDGCEVIVQRSALQGRTRGEGAMWLARTGEARARGALVAGASVAACNGPDETLISGAPSATSQVASALEAQGVEVRALRIDIAAHSAQMQPLAEELVRTLDIHPRCPRVPMLSSVTAGPLPLPDAAYWGENLRQPVRFQQAVEAASVPPGAAWVEIGPHPVLGRALASMVHGPVLAVMHRQQPFAFEAALAALGGPRPAPAEAQLFLLSAADEAALQARVARLPEGGEDLAWTLATRREPLRHRAALLRFADGREELRRGARRAGPRPRTVMAFSGQGPIWAGMLELELPVFQEALDRVDAALRPHLATSIRETPLPERVDRVQPLIFAVQLALAWTWQALGVRPDLVIGHSMGEVAAAVVSGALGLEDAAQVICARSAVLRRISGQGGMMTVSLGAEAARRLAEPVGASLAADNGGGYSVISGPEQALSRVAAASEAQGVDWRRVPVDVPAHSAALEPLMPALREAVGGIEPRAGEVPLWSTVTASRLEGDAMDPAYWAQNLREPVRFGEAMRGLLAEGPVRLVELSPHPVLLGVMGDLARGAGAQACAVGSLRRGVSPRAALLASAGELFCDGVDLDLGPLFPHEGRHQPLPPYPWQRERFWPAPAAVEREHPLLGPHVRSSLLEGAHLFDAALSLDDNPELGDHRVAGQPWIAAGLLLDAVLSAAEQALGVTPGLSGLRFIRPVLPEGRLQIALLPPEGEGVPFRVSTWEDGRWHAALSGQLVEVEAAGAFVMPAGAGQTPEGHHQRLAALGLELGPSLRRAARTWREARVTLELRPGAARAAQLDAALQCLIPDELRVAARIDALWCTGPARFTQGAGEEAWLADAQGEVVGGLRGVRLAPPPVAQLYVQRWRPLGPAGARRAGERWVVLGAPELARAVEAAQTLAGPVDGVALFSAPRGPEDLEEALLRVRELALRLRGGAARLVLVTAGPLARGLHGFARSLAVELPELGLRVVEVERAVDAASELSLAAEEPHVRRATQRLAPALAPLYTPTSPPSLPGRWLITGGLGGVGLALAEWLDRRGVEQLVLLSRRPPGAEARARLTALRAPVRVVRGDVTDSARVAELLRRHPVDALIHAAGEPAVGAWSEVDAAGLRRSLAAKLRGAWNLHQHADVERFVLSSSVVGTVGLPGQALYAAANASLDGLAELRRAQGKPALSVAWCGWEGVGLARTPAGRAALGSLGRLGVPALPAEEALALLSPLLSGATPPVVAVLPEGPPRASRAATPRVLETLRAAPTAEAQQVVLRSYLQEQLAEVLGGHRGELPADRPFKELGVDSIMGVELRDRVELGLGIPLATTLIWQHPTLERLGAALHARVQLDAGALEASPAPRAGT